ncbi:G-protein coupled receptor [Biomphalaria glabrata]|nr:putative G-protein coupled receptor [Biomphalaria glabrata]
MARNKTYTSFAICNFDYSDKYRILTLQIMDCYINPIVSILGFIANMMSIEILRRSGLNKSSNILLLGLVVSDSMSQMTTMNFAIILETFGPNWEYPELCGWQYGDELNYFLLVCNIVFKFLGFWGQYVNTAVPVLIVVERVLAVFKPLAFRNIVTRRAVVVGVVSTYIFWLPWSVFWMTIYNVSILMSKVMFLSRDTFLIKEMTVFTVFYFYVCDILSSWFPMSFVIMGCILTWVKVKRTLNQRKKLTAAGQRVQWSKKTTRTLLTTCSIFSITHVVYSVMNYLIPDDDLLIHYIKLDFMSLVYLINTSSNFFVYVLANRKLMNVFRQIMHFDRHQV